MRPVPLAAGLGMAFGSVRRNVGVQANCYRLAVDHDFGFGVAAGAGRRRLHGDGNNEIAVFDFGFHAVPFSWPLLPAACGLVQSMRGLILALALSENFFQFRVKVVGLVELFPVLVLVDTWDLSR